MYSIRQRHSCRLGEWLHDSSPWGGKVLEVLTAPLMRSLVFRKILAGCAKALEA